MPFALLLAMQASGMVVDYIGSRNQNTMTNMGMKVEQAGIESNIYQTRLETEDASLQSIKQLRQTLGSQIAVFAARGTSTGGGSAISLLNESVSNFNSDDRMRRLNGLGKENQLRGGAALSRLQNASDVSKLWQGFASRTINRFPSSVAGWKQGMTDFKQGVQTLKQSFGLTSIGER
jgi:uncharacterized protein YukE